MRKKCYTNVTWAVQLKKKEERGNIWQRNPNIGFFETF